MDLFQTREPNLTLCMKIYITENYSILTGNKYKNYYNEENIKFYKGIMVSLKDFENLN